MTTINSSFRVTGGETQRAPNNAFPGEREISIFPASFTGVPSPAQWSGQKVWLLVPGFTELRTHFDETLAPAIQNTNPNDVVFALDWTQVSGSLDAAPVAIPLGDLYRSASWITPVANAVRDKLISWGMPAAALNLIGDSLGAYLSSEIAASFSAVGGQVGSVTALDPASNTASFASPYDTIDGFDTDISNGFSENNGIPDPVKRLDLGATVARGFNGRSSPSGNETQSGTAKESFLFDFGNFVTSKEIQLSVTIIPPPTDNIEAQFAEHARVVTAYTNLVTTDTNGNSRLATNILGVNDTLADHQFRPNFYKGGYDDSPQVHEGVIPVDGQNNPLFLVAAKPDNGINGINDRFIYGTNNDDSFDTGFLPTITNPFSRYYNNNGNHTYYLGNGDDTVFAGTGNDTIFGGAGNDYLDGGDGRNTIRGEGGNDTITGGSGVNILFGGRGNDILDGGTGQSILRGSETTTNWLSDAELDVLIGSSGNLSTAFYIGDGTRNWYSSHGMNDYAEIQNFNAATDVILGGANINSQDNNPLNQTFLWSGNELVAKIDGLWASQLQFNSRSPIV